MTKNNSLKLGYDYDAWHGYGQRDVLFTDISLKTNSHMILCGMSGSGKSYALVWCLKMLILASPPEAEYFFADFKQDDSFAFLRGCGLPFLQNDSRILSGLTWKCAISAVIQVQERQEVC